MTDDDQNDGGQIIAPRLPRESRAEPAGAPRALAAVVRRMTTRARKMDDVKGSVGCALGLPAHAQGACAASGRRRDRPNGTAAQPRARLETLEETA